jgi:hypothetical protein
MRKYGQHPAFTTPKQDQHEDARTQREASAFAYFTRPTMPPRNARILRVVTKPEANA